MELTECLSNLIESVLVHLTALRDQVSDRTVLAFLLLQRFRDLVYILRLRKGFQVVLEHFREVVCSQLASTASISDHENPLCNSEPRKYFNISSQSGGFSYLPKFGFSLPLNTFNAVLFPIPFVPTRPNTCPGLGIGSLCSLKLFAE
jgi:hypothetical protein